MLRPIRPDLASTFIVIVVVLGASPAFAAPDDWPSVTLEGGVSSPYQDDEAGVFVLISGHRVPVRDIDGRAGRLVNEYTVVYPNGSRFTLNEKSQRLMFEGSDGSKRSYFGRSASRFAGYGYDAATDSIRTPHGYDTPARNSDGSLPWITPHGGVHYADGSGMTADENSVTFRDASGGSRTFFKVSGAGAGGIRYDAEGDTFTTASGMSVPGRDANGDRGWVNDKGDLLFDDGTLVTSDATSTTVIRADGSAISYFSETGNTPQGTSYDANSGTYRTRAGHLVPGTDRTGDLAGVNSKGDIIYGDGTIITGDETTTTIIQPDGSSSTYFNSDRSGMGPGGVYHDSNDDTLTTPEGHTFPAHDSQGRSARVGSDGSITYSDGTVVRSYNKNSYTVSHADGSSETRFTGNGSGPSGSYYDAKRDTFITETGHILPGTDRNGASGYINEKGDIIYADGTIVVTDTSNGSITILHGSGGSTTIAAGQSTGTRTGGGGSSSGSSGTDDDSSGDDSEDDDDSDDSEHSDSDGDDSDGDDSSDDGSDDEGSGDEGGGDDDEPDELSSGVDGTYSTGPRSDVEELLRRSQEIGRGGRDDVVSDCGPGKQPIISPDGGVIGCSGVPASGPGEGEEDGDSEIWIWTAPSGGIDDPLGPVSQPGLHEGRERETRTIPIFKNLEHVTDPPPD